MSARRPVLVLAALALAWWSTTAPCAEAAAEGESGGPGVRVVRSGDFEITDIVVPGILLHWAVQEQGSERFAVLLLSGAPVLREPEPPEDEAGDSRDSGKPLPPCPDDPEAGRDRPRSLWLVRGRGERRLEPLRDGLSADVARVLVVPSDGGESPLLAGGDRIVRLGHRGETGDRVVFEGPGAGGAAAIEGRPSLLVVDTGRAVVLRAGGDGFWTEAAEAPLPVRARVRRDSMDVWTAGPGWVGRSRGGVAFLATGREAVGSRRVQTTVLRGEVDGSWTSIDAWARLPDAEDLLESGILLFDGAPLLVATTKEADRLGLFAEKRLRVYPVLADRSHLGHEPLLAAESRINLWQGARFFARDVDGDGRDDLVVGYWKGLKDDRVVLDAYVRRDDGTFAEKPRTTAFDVEDGDRSWVGYGGDVDGDGIPDLVVRAGGEFRLHRGRQPARRGDLVDKDAVRILDGPDGNGSGGETVVALGSDGVSVVERFGTGGTPSFRDLDGDGRDEIVVWRYGGARDRGKLRIVRYVGRTDDAD